MPGLGLEASQQVQRTIPQQWLCNVYKRYVFQRSAIKRKNSTKLDSTCGITAGPVGQNAIAWSHWATAFHLFCSGGLLVTTQRFGTKSFRLKRQYVSLSYVKLLAIPTPLEPLLCPKSSLNIPKSASLRPTTCWT